MIVKGIGRVQDGGQSPLGVIGVGIRDFALGQEDHLAELSGFDSRSQARGPAADDRYVGENVRDAPAGKAHEISTLEICIGHFLIQCKNPFL